MSAYDIHQFEYLSDNYGVLLHDKASGQTTCIDAGDAQATVKALEDTGWQLSEIWITHHHADHTAGLLELKKLTQAKVIGPEQLSSKIDGLDVTVKDNDEFAFADQAVKVIHTPGHTMDMMNYYLPSLGIVFTGDTLFTMGCGRLFEGDAATMHTSLQKLKALPSSTKIYSSHEYTLANVAFALSVDPDNQALKERSQVIEQLRANNKPTVPSTLEEELATNPFLRAADPAIRRLLNLQDASDSEVFAEVRRRKDAF